MIITSPQEIKEKEQLAAFRQCFPAIAQQSIGCYLDNAATTQKPDEVIEKVCDYWRTGVANVHRSSHQRATSITQELEASRTAIADFIHTSANNIVFTKNATEAINLIAQSWGASQLCEQDTIIVSAQEHHANLVPWQQLQQATGCQLVIWQTNVLMLDSAELRSMLSGLANDGKCLLAVNHIANSTGAVNDIKAIIEMAHEHHCTVVVDASQSVAHCELNVTALDCDFLVFSGHKCYGPEGIGVLYAKQQHLAVMPAWQTGGEMVKQVEYAHAEFQEAPLKFEAGTPNISGIIGLAQAIRFIKRWDRKLLAAHEQQLVKLADSGLAKLPGYTAYTPNIGSSAILSFAFDGVHAQDLVALLDEQAIATRAGYLCANPWVKQQNQQGIIRISVAPYNNQLDIQQLIIAVENALTIIR